MELELLEVSMVYPMPGNFLLTKNMAKEWKLVLTAKYTKEHIMKVFAMEKGSSSFPINLPSKWNIIEAFG